VVEHDEDAIMAADYVVDVGPYAGVHGGRIVAEGTPAEIMANPDSITGQYLSGDLEIAMPAKRREISKSRRLRVTGAAGNNLKHVDAAIPLGTFTA
jgi:excinuclease ABC subunit A